MRGPATDWRAGLFAVPPGGIAVFSAARGPLAGRRLARALLEEAAVLGGGQVVPLPGGDLLLGSHAAPGQRAAQAIGAVTGRLPEIWPLPVEREAAEACCLAAWNDIRPPAGGIPALEALCLSRPIEELARLTLFTEGQGRQPVAQRLGPAPLGMEDPELEALAREWQCRRLLAALTHPEERGRLPALRPGLRLILDLPLGGLPQGAPLQGGAADDPNGPIALLPLASLADPAGFAATSAGLRRAGWAVGLLTTDAAALGWVAAPDIIWAAPAGAESPSPRPMRLIALGHPAPDWCRAPGILHEGIGA